MSKQAVMVQRKKAPKLKLEVGYTPPPRHTYDFETFQKGHSFLIETKTEMLKIRNAAYAWARRMNKRHENDMKYAPIEFRCCRDEETKGWRLFRTE